MIRNILFLILLPLMVFGNNNAIDELFPVKSGWQLVGTRGNIPSAKLITQFVGVEGVWQYYYNQISKKSEWRYTPSVDEENLEKLGIKEIQSIKQNEGFWLYFKSDSDKSSAYILLYSDFFGKNCTSRDKQTTYKLHKGWQMISPTGTIDDVSQLENDQHIRIVWQYDDENNIWRVLKIPSLYNKYQKIKNIKPFEGVWVLANEDCNITIKDSFRKEYCKDATLYLEDFKDKTSQNNNTPSYIILGQEDATKGIFDDFDIKNISDKPIKMENIILSEDSTMTKNFKSGTIKVNSPYNCTIAFKTMGLYPFVLQPDTGYYIDDLFDGVSIDDSKTTCDLSLLQGKECKSDELITEHQIFTFYLSDGSSFKKERTTKIKCAE